MQYVKVTEPTITHTDQEQDGITFETVGSGDYYRLDGDQTAIDAWVVREFATVIDEETDTDFLAFFRAYKKEQFSIELNNRADEYFGQYTQAETALFYLQKEEIDAYLLDNNADTPIIDAMSTARGITRGQQASKIQTQFSNLNTNLATLIGKKQKVFDDIDAATTFTAIKAVVWPT